MVISENRKVRFFAKNITLSILFLLSLFYSVSYPITALYADSPEEELTQKTKPKEIDLEGMIFFAKKSAKMSDSDLKKLQLIAEHLIHNSDSRIYIRAHAWDGGHEKEEIALSEKRSLEVERFLILHGVKENQIHRLFYGNARPLDHALTSSDQSIQRRVEYQVISE